ncbi:MULTISPECIES: DUF2630 family protein [Actinokineospora]|uniref:DUF2630 family protein n=1 Tax=Actinokineospora fastidiosa TaxID=1816 RepID=A0A918GHF2_9PSEU|nr:MULTISPECIES: DUF2630 family protein [Actinokineospora]UVS80826.1 hypothetical protein Actkin_04578 [Actinokineospora sp. UTMC 2448]GGS37463.1 hypothetical protein GCM10010171_35440 [Actinokineospora fastidiosa]
MDDTDIHDRIKGLIDEEHRLRERAQQGDIEPDDEARRLRAVEVQLDQCWDLLRQRRALRGASDDPDAAAPRDESTVENYRQ